MKVSLSFCAAIVSATISFGLGVPIVSIPAAAILVGGQIAVQAPRFIQNCLRSCRRTSFPQIDQIQGSVFSEEDNENLVKFFSCIPNRPNLQSPDDIRSWLNNKDNVNSVIELDLSNLSLTALPHQIILFENLKTLKLAHNQLIDLPALPAGLIYLEAFDNQLTALPALPAGLTHLEAHNNQQLSRLFPPD